MCTHCVCVSFLLPLDINHSFFLYFIVKQMTKSAVIDLKTCWQFWSFVCNKSGSGPVAAFLALLLLSCFGSQPFGPRRKDSSLKTIQICFWSCSARTPPSRRRDRLMAISVTARHAVALEEFCQVMNSSLSSGLKRHSTVLVSCYCAINLCSR